MAPFRFYLGAFHVGWLGRVNVPLFVRRRSFAGRRAYPRAAAPWVLDGGGFTELSLFGRWSVTAEEYARQVGEIAEGAGMPEWVPCMDWMAEPFMLGRTGLTVAEHQRRTTESYLELRALAPALPWIPVLQGWEYADYLRHLEGYARAGVGLRSLPVVGLGSVCRRQATGAVEALVRELHGMGIRVHGFGLKTAAVSRVAPYLASSDSMAWSFDARRGQPLPGCTHRKCSSCPKYALRWRERVVRLAGRACSAPVRQGVLPWS